MNSKRINRREFGLAAAGSLLAASLGGGLAAPAAAQAFGAGRELAKPTGQQLAFQDLELGAFIHYSIDTHGGVSGRMPASAFNPPRLDAEQWVLAAKAMGARYAVLTARHEQGFCLWPTATTPYSVKNSPYKDGKGDIVREFVDACRKHGLKPGLYTSPWIDDHFDANTLGLAAGKGNGDFDKYDDPDHYTKVWRKEMLQMRELLRGYGPLVFFWDEHYGRSDSLGPDPQGGRLRELYADLGKRARQLQPGMLYLGPDVEHVGNEDGQCCHRMWNAVDTLDDTRDSISTTFKWRDENPGVPRGQFYRPRLGPSSKALSSGGWMWTGPRTVQPLQERLRAYYELVGRGASAIFNLTPDASGRIPDDLVAAATEMGDEIRRRFAKPVAQTQASGLSATLRFAAPRKVDHLVTMEELGQGQKIARYRIDACVDGNWRTVAEGRTVGHKRIDRIAPLLVTELRFTCTESIEPAVGIRSFAAYDSSA